MGIVTALLASTVATVGIASTAAAAPSTVSQTFTYSTSAQSFTVPAGITQLTVSLSGAEGGLGGPDNTVPTPGGYKGVVTGTIDVTPGVVLSIGVGKGGTSGTARSGNSGNASAAGGTNPIGGYAGGAGGIAGNAGSSGNGAGGGAATVVTVGTTTLIAGGGGGGGGSGQFGPLTGRPGEATYKARLDGVTSTTGQVGLDTMTFCAPLTSCDGGASGGGGGGAGGGARGAVEYGAGSATEYFGYGGFPGSSSTAGLGTLSAIYQYYATNANNGSVTISYATGSPAAPTTVSGTAADSAVALSWVPPTNTGGAPVTDYVIEYSANSGTSWSTFTDGVSTATSTTVTGLTNGTAYLFRVTAVNSFGNGTVSANSSPVTPSAVPTAPVIGTIAPGNGTLTVPFTGVTSYSPILGYEYSIDGGDWFNAGTTTSPVTVAGLTNGTAYAVRVRAYSAIGMGAASSPATGTPSAVPGAPSITSATTGADRAVVTFSPGSTGGLPITGYEYQLNGGAWVAANSTTSPITVTGLTDGTLYTLRLRGLNSLGAGAASPATTLTTSRTPGAPTVSSVTPLDRSLSVSFAPSGTGGLSITGYEYQLNGGAWVAAPGTASPMLITGLTNGTGYAVAVRAVNPVGAGATSNPLSGTPRTVPSAPVITSNTFAAGALSIAFTPPTSDGGAAITGYEYSTDAGATWRARTDAGSGSPLAITTLSSDGTTPIVDGTDYPVELRAVNAAGPGTASSSTSVSGRVVPDAPVIASVTGRPGALQVTVNPPANGGASIDRYEYRLGTTGSWVDTGTPGATFVIPGLNNGTSYPVQVRAVNSVGNSTESAPVSGTPVAGPGTAVITDVAPIDRALRITATVPTDGGSPVTGWEYTTDGGTTWAAAGSATSPFTVSTLSSNGAPLVNGTSYAVAVRARNAVDVGGASGTVAVAPSATPSSPTITVTPQNGRLQVGYIIGSDGGSPITDVQYRINGGTWTTAGSTVSPFIIGGLTNGTSYAVEVRGINTRGDGASSAVVSGVPRTVPDAPTAVTVIGNDVSAAVSWTAPANNGGSAVTGYTATAWSAATGGTAVSTCSSATTSCTLTGLVNSTTYYVSVVATNAAGTGVASSPRVAVTPVARPAAPTITGITPANTYLTVAFNAGAAGTSAITGYQYQLNGGTWVNAPAGTSSPITISGLTNGTAYAVNIRAISAAGNGATSNTVTQTPYTLPDIPNSATITGTGAANSVTVKWVAPANNGSPITGYNVVLWSAATLGSQSYTCNPGAALTCTISGLSNATVYYATVDATNAAGTTVRSSPRVAVAAGTAPSAPTSVSGTSGDTQVALTWTAGAVGTGAAITDYLISYSTDGTTYTTFSDAVSTATSATVTGLTNGTAYFFKVQALSPSGSSPVSAASAAVTPSGIGTVPTFGAVTRTADGYTVAIANYDAATTYTVATTAGSVARSGATITVTGLAPGASADVTVTAARSGFSTRTGTVSGTALAAGTAPTFGTVTRTVDGFTVPITNLDGSTAYTVATTAGTVTRSGSTLTVTGLAAGAPADVTVTAARAGYSTVTGTVSGGALPAGTVPTFGAVTQLADGYSVGITNYDATGTYTLSSTGGTVTRAGSIVTVSGLAPAAAATVTATVSKAGFGPATGTVSGAALGVGTVPTLSPPIGTNTGFTFDITNYNADTDYALSATRGTVTRIGSTVVVTGLEPGESSTVTTTGSRPGYTSRSATTSGTALQAGTAPALSPSTSTADGFFFDITNRDSGTAYTFTSTAGSVSRTGNRVTVSGLAPGGSGDVTVTANRPGYAVASSSTSGTALLAGTTPILGAATSNADGFEFAITNFDAGTTYTVSSTAGTVVRSGGTIGVAGLAPGISATVTVTASRPGYTTTSAGVTGSALESGTAPEFSAVTQLVDGFSFEITNFGFGPVYTLDTSAGTVTRDGRFVTVTGLTPGAPATVTVTAVRPGATPASGTLSGSALQTGTAPTTSAVVRTATGYTFEITNLDPAISYGATSTDGSVGISGTTVTVTGLAAGATADVTLTATRPGYTTGSVTVTGAALATGTAPTTSAVTRLVDGYQFEITNLDPETEYSATVTDGTVSIVGSVVTVSGLAAGASATATVTAARTGFTPASASVTSFALDTGTAPVLSAVTRLADGFALEIADPDPAVDYTVSVTAGVVAFDGGVITVSGLAPGESATVTVTATRDGFTTTTATATGTALETGTVPALSAVTRLVDGFSFDITNYDPDTTYVLDVTGGTVTQDGAVVTVSGLAPGGTADVSVSAVRDGFTTATGSVGGAALETGTAPVLSGGTRLADGFSFQITNLDPDTTYTATTTDGTVTVDGSTVTVSGLAPGTAAGVTVTATRAGFTTTTATTSGTALDTGVTPTLSPATRLPDGFSFEITDLDPDATYVLTTSAGTVTRDGSVVTVSGLAPGGGADVTISAVKSGFTTATATVSSTTLGTGVTPTFSDVTRSADGFSFEITNLDPGTAYTATVTNGTVTISGTTVTVGGLAPGASAAVTVTATRDGFTAGSAGTSGTALLTGTTPVLGAPVSTADGYLVEITNPGPDTTYTATVATGTVTISGTTVTVSGLAPGSSAELAVTATRAGYTPESAGTSGTALLTGTAPVLGTAVPGADGYTVDITDLDPLVTYTVSTTSGTATLTGNTVTVSGLEPGASAALTVTAIRAGYTTTSAALLSAALRTGTVPTVSPVTRLTDGYTFEITNLDPDVTYTVTSTGGTAVLSGNVVVVSGLASGGSSTVTVTAVHGGFTTTTTTVTGAALATGTAPAVSARTGTADGFTFEITNFDPDADYVLTATNGTVTRTGSTVTVSGLAAGQTTEVVLTANRAGFTSAATTVAGSSLSTVALTVFGGPAVTAMSGAQVISGTTDAPPGTLVTVTVAGLTLTTTVGDDGSWSITATLPAGEYDVLVSISVLGVTATTTQSLTVMSSGEGPTPDPGTDNGTTPDPDTDGVTTPVDSGPIAVPPLAYTGFDTRVPGIVGGGLFLIGSLLVLITRRRRPVTTVRSEFSNGGEPPVG